MTKLPDGWIEHDGGPCPVADHAIVDALLRDGQCGENRCADTLFWEHDGRRDDIVAYRVHP